MRKIPILALAFGVLVSADAALAQTPAVGDAPGAATVGQDVGIARQREFYRERGMTTGFAIHRNMRGDRMLPERFAPDAEEAAPAGH